MREKEDLRSLHFGSARAFLGTSPAAQRLAGLVPRLAASEVSVLIEGETGVGKTFVARLIHEASPRAREPLRVINCAAIPENLLESELFCHERGAFTGANVRRIGAFESAGRGTLFLDEIGELSLASQAKLLRALEEKRFERLGSNRTLELRARVLCATNRDLAATVAEGRFRSDLLFRVSVVKLPIPPLRERGDDVALLAKHVLQDVAREAHRRIDGFSDDALEAIVRYSWPGNVRELRNVIELAIVIGDAAVLRRVRSPRSARGPLGARAPGDRGRRYGGRDRNPPGALVVAGGARDRGGAPGRAKQPHPRRGAARDPALDALQQARRPSDAPGRRARLTRGGCLPADGRGTSSVQLLDGAAKPLRRDHALFRKTGVAPTLLNGRARCPPTEQKQRAATRPRPTASATWPTVSSPRPSALRYRDPSR